MTNILFIMPGVHVASFTWVMLQLKKSEEIQHAKLLVTKYKLVASPVQGWLLLRFSLSTGNATSPSQAKQYKQNMVKGKVI